MALTYSEMTALGSMAPDFRLPAANPSLDDPANEMRELNDFAGGKALVVAFICNHCPFVVHMEDALLGVARAYQARGVRFVGISANDARMYPADSFENMARRAHEKTYPFPYLYDETQETAVAYGAACTPDIFVYDDALTLVYRGRFDETRPGLGTAHGGDLVQALDELLDSGTVTMDQVPSMGCNIKWK